MLSRDKDEQPESTGLGQAAEARRPKFAQNKTNGGYGNAIAELHVNY